MLDPHANIPARKLGFELHFPSTAPQDLIAQKSEILSALNQHGCVCIKNVDFRQKDLLDFSKGIWPTVLTLPKFLCFGNQDETYKQVARVGNVLLDGTLKDSQKEAAYWHQDGDFWGEHNKHIFNCLHTREIPEKGGDTYVMDLKAGAQFLKKNKPDLYSKLMGLVGVLDIEKIYDFVLYNAKNTLNIESVTKHQVVRRDPTKNDECLFLSFHKFMDSTTLQQNKQLNVQEIHEFLEKQMGFYAHKWQKGDLLIWDNLQVMHRSSGSFDGRRLLFRTQGKFE